MIEKVSSYLTYVLCSIFTGVLVIMFVQLNKKSTTINNSSFILSSLRKSDSFFVKNWKLLVLLRLYASLVILVYLQDYYASQIMILLLLSIIYQGFQIGYKPFEEKNENYIELFNEIMNSIYLLNLLSLSDYSVAQTASIRDIQGWILLVLCLITVLVNVCILLKAKYENARKFIL